MESSDALNSEEIEYSLLWNIENYSYFNFQELMTSPEFKTKGLKGTSWELCFLHNKLDEKYFNISLYLARSKEDGGPKNFSAKYEISIAAVDGSIVFSAEGEHAFKRGDRRKINARLGGPKLFEIRDAKLSVRDILSVHCRLRCSEGEVLRVSRYSVRTHVGIEDISFVHRVSNFSALELDEKRSIQVPSQSDGGCTFSHRMWINGGFHLTGCIKDWITPSKACVVQRRKISILDASGAARRCGNIDYRYKKCDGAEMKMYHTFTREFILSKGNEYLPNDELAMLCEFTFSTSVESTVEETVHEIPAVAYKQCFSTEVKPD